MLCENCKNKPVARGLKSIKCLSCGENKLTNYAYNSGICENCSDKLAKCVCCGGLNNSSKYSVITLCGSTKFKDDFIKAQEELTLQGNIVISVGLFGHADGKYDNVLTDEVKEMLDDMHKRKIDMADEVFVINTNGYIGSSTRSEIEYAVKTGKPIKYMY